MQKCKVKLLWWKAHLKDYFVCHITSSIIADLKEILLQEKTPHGPLRSKSIANRYLAALSSVFTIAIKEWNWLKDNPVSNISGYEEGKARDRFLTKQAIEKLLAICKTSRSPHLDPATLFAVCSGARKGEVLRLKLYFVQNGERNVGKQKVDQNQGYHLHDSWRYLKLPNRGGV